MKKALSISLFLTIALIAALLYVKDAFTINIKHKESSIEIKAENKSAESELQQKHIEEIKPQKTTKNIINITNGNNSPITNKY